MSKAFFSLLFGIFGIFGIFFLFFSSFLGYVLLLLAIICGKENILKFLKDVNLKDVNKLAIFSFLFSIIG